MKKKLLAMLVSLSMVIALLPTAAFAIGGETSVTTEVATELPSAVNGVITLTENIELANKVTIDSDVTIKSAEGGPYTITTGNAYDPILVTSGKLTLENIIISGNAELLCLNGGDADIGTGAKLTSTNHEENCPTVGVAEGTLTLNGGEIIATGTKNNAVALVADDCYFNLEAGTVKWSGANPGAAISAVCNAEIAITGGKVNAPSGQAAFAVYANETYPNTKLTISGDAEVSGVFNFTGDMEPCSITGGTFSDLSALNYLGENANVTIKLADDISVSEDEAIVVNSNVTIKSAEGGPYTITTGNAYDPILVTSGKLTLENIIISGNAELLCLNGGDADIGTGAKLTSTNHEENCPTVGVAEGTLTLNGGEIIATGTKNNAVALVADDCYFNLEAGTVKWSGANPGAAISAVCNAEIAITGGKVNAPSGQAAFAVYANETYPNTKLTISGDAEVSGVFNFTGDMEPCSITGGTFTVNPSAYVPSTHQVTESNGTFTVVEKTAPSTPSYGGGGGGGGSVSNTTSTTTKNPDGSTTTTTTDKSTGTVTETTKKPDGSIETVKTEKDGTVTTTVQTKDGSKAETTVDKNGAQSTAVTVSDKAVKAAAAAGEAVTLPVAPVTAPTSSASAPTVTVSLPRGTSNAVVEIPVNNVTAGTVAIIVYPDGTEKVVAATVPTEDGIALPIENGATVKIVDNSKDFSDVARDHVFNGSIDFASARGIVEGYANGGFGPAGPATSNAVVTVVARIMGNDFYGEGAVGKANEWAAELGITDGLDMSGSITRGAFMTMLWRAAGTPVVSSAGVSFTDAGSMDAAEQAAFAWAVENGVIGGYADGSVRPDAGITRGAMAAIAQRYMTRQ